MILSVFRLMQTLISQSKIRRKKKQIQQHLVIFGGRKGGLQTSSIRFRGAGALDASGRLHSFFQSDSLRITQLQKHSTDKCAARLIPARRRRHRVASSFAMERVFKKKILKYWEESTQPYC